MTLNYKIFQQLFQLYSKEKNEILISISSLKKIEDSYPFEYSFFEQSINLIPHQKNKYLISIQNEENFNSFIESKIDFFQKEFKNRTDISSFKSTHYKKSNYNKLLMYINSKINIFVIEENGIITHNVDSLFNSCILIENQDNFFEYKTILEKLKHYNLDFNQLDIIFGDGNSITDSKFHSFLKKYKNIYTFFDLDKTGFEMYFNIKKNINFNTQMLYVKNIEKYFQISKNRFQHKISFSDFLKYKDNGLVNSSDEIVLDLMLNKYNIGLEQEIFLKDI